MATPVLIIGKSGSGKSTSLRNCQNEHWNLIRVLNKPLPFKGKIDGWFTDDYQQVMNCCLLSQEVSKILENIGNLQAQDFMEKQLYEELFTIKSKIDRSEIKFKLMDRAKSVKASAEDERGA